MSTPTSSHSDRNVDLHADPRSRRLTRQPPYRCRPIHDAAPDYKGWSVEELRAFAAQMQVPDAARKSRGELLAIFEVSAATLRRTDRVVGER
jgi:hypothetical protein